MKTAWMIGAIAAVEMAARTFGAVPEVTVYASSDAAVPMAVLQRAELVAGRIFAGIGLTVRWRSGRPQACVGGREAEALAIRLEAGIPTGPHADALAFANPERGGVMIHVFYSKVSAAYRPDLVHVMLGYVLAHEMGHVLQGMSRHSEDGVMKASWTPDDCSEMASGRLAFAPVDAMIMLRRLAAAAAEAEQAKRL